MRDFLIILIVSFVLFGVFRRMMFGSFYAAMKKHQDDQQRKEDAERKRKREGKILIEKIKPGTSLSHDEDQYADYEELN